MKPRPSVQSEKQKPSLSLAQVLRRRHHRQWGFFWVALLGLITICIADHAGYFIYPGDMMRQYEDRWFQVDRVVDGDTLDILPLDKGDPIRLRLWGIDTPEIANQYKGTADQPWAREAFDWTDTFCAGNKVRLKLQPQRIWGTYGRLLCYVYLEDGRMLNEQLLLKGLAKVDNRFVHQHMNRFEILSQQAQFDKVGVWSKSRSKSKSTSKKPRTP